MRGEGIYQPGMDEALELLNRKRWFHVFSEALVNQGSHLAPFKWGIGRLIMESKDPPLVVPFYHTGLEKVIPETRKIKYPSIGKLITCRFGHPIDSQDLLNRTKHLPDSEQRAKITQYLFQETDKLRVQTLDALEQKSTNLE